MAREACTAIDAKIPFCTFNGGRDVFVDIGSKEIGLTALKKYLDVRGEHTLHVGDQFTRTGNDLLARRAASTLWVDKPSETMVLLNELVCGIEAAGNCGDRDKYR